jgi:hypothetical protein
VYVMRCGRGLGVRGAHSDTYGNSKCGAGETAIAPAGSLADPRLSVSRSAQHLSGHAQRDGEGGRRPGPPVGRLCLFGMPRSVYCSPAFFTASSNGTPCSSSFSIATRCLRESCFSCAQVSSRIHWSGVSFAASLAGISMLQGKTSKRARGDNWCVPARSAALGGRWRGQRHFLVPPRAHFGWSFPVAPTYLRLIHAQRAPTMRACFC